MKSAIFFYSYSGNTKKVAELLAEYLKSKGEATLFEIKALDESNFFLAQCSRAFKRARAKVEDLPWDLGAYDLVCFGTPVWAFGPAPAINTCLDKCLGAKQQTILFSTYGSGTGNERCLKYMQNVLEKKGATRFKKFSISQSKINDQEFIKNKIRECFEK